MWYSPTTDNRGRMLVDFLSTHALLTENVKDGPTYSGPTGVSWIDIRVTMINSAHRIHNWRVSEEWTLSDHELILFYLTTQAANRNLNCSACNSTRKFATQLGNRPLFYHGIQQNGRQWTDLVNGATTKEQLDIFIREIWYNLESISKRCFPPFLPKTKFVPWWSPKLKVLRKQVNALKRRFKRHKNPDFKETTNARFKALKNV